MGAAIPIIATVVSVAGTAASISAQNRQASQQNAMVNAQINANRDFERIRQMQNATQQTIINDQLRLQKMSIQQNMNAERGQLINQRYSALSQLRQQQLAQQLELDEVRRQVAQEQSNLLTQQRDTESALRENEVQTIQQAAQAVASLANPTADIQSLRDQVEVNASQIAAYTGSRGKTAAIQGRLSPAQVQEAARILQETRGITFEAAQAIASTKEFSDITRRMSEIQSAQQANQLQTVQRNARQQTNITSQLSRAQAQGSLQQNRIAVQQNDLSRRSQINQAETNAQFALGSLITGNALSAAQSVASSAQAESQRQSGVGGLSALAQLGSALMPLSQLIPNNPQATVPAYGSNQGGIMSQLSNKNFNSVYQPQSRFSYQMFQQPQSPKTFNPSMASQVPVTYKNWSAR